MAEPQKVDNSRLREAAAADESAAPAVRFENQVRVWFRDNGRKLVTMLGDKKDADRLILTFLEVASKTPKILSCDPMSWWTCLMNSATLNLFPGAMQECAYVPLNNNKKRSIEAQFWPMYPGLVKLTLNSGQVKKLSTGIVYEKDEFDFQRGTDERIYHKPALIDRKERGNRIAAYACVWTRYGECQFEIVPISFCEMIRNKAPAGNNADSPWKASEDSYDQMCRKTALKQALKLVPKSSELALALELDNETEKEPGAMAPLRFDVEGFVASTEQEKQEQQPPAEQKPAEQEKPKALEHQEVETIVLNIPPKESIEVSAAAPKQEQLLKGAVRQEK